MTPRTFSELLADSLLLFKESALEWGVIVAAGLVPGVTVTALVLLALGLSDIPTLKAAIAQGDNGTVLPLLFSGLLDKTCGALSILALTRAAAARDEGHILGVKKAYSEALPRLLPFALGQLLAFLSVLWGLVKLIWPGLKLCVLYTFVPVAVIVEDRRGKQALERSAAVARADLGKMMGNLAAATALACVGYAVLAFVMTAAMTFPRTAIPGEESLPEAMLLGFMNQFLGGIVFGWLTAFTILLYRDLAPGAK